MKKTTYAAVACVLLVLAGGLYYFLRTEPYSPQVSQEAKSDFTENITFVGNSIVEQENGRKKWEMTAESSSVDPNTNKVQMNNITAVFYRDNGGKIDLVAKKANYNPKSRDILLEGEVKAVSSDGAVFLAANARWASKERHFYGNGGISLTRGDTVITGDQVDTDANMEKVKVQGNAHVIKGGISQ